jgi:cellulase
MKNFALIALAASAKLAFAHTTIYAAWINGEDQGLGNSADGYIRSPPNNNPVKDVTSSDMTCNVNNVATAETLSVAAGDEVREPTYHEDRSSNVAPPVHFRMAPQRPQRL